MNKNRRKQIDVILDQLNPLLLEIESVKNKEQEAYDNLPESMQNRDKGEKMSDAVNSLEYALHSEVLKWKTTILNNWEKMIYN